METRFRTDFGGILFEKSQTILHIVHLGLGILITYITKMRLITARIEKNNPSEDLLIIQGPDGVYTLTGSTVESMLIDAGLMCEYCGDTGEINTDEDDGEGHLQVGVGTQKCICKTKVDEFHDQDK